MELVRNKPASVAFLQQHGILHNPRVCQRSCYEPGIERPSGQMAMQKMRLSRCCSTEEYQASGLTAALSWYNYISLLLEFSIYFYNFVKVSWRWTKNTVVDWNNYIREVCAASLNNLIVIGGPNTTVEIDENMFSRRKNHAGRVPPQQWVFGGIWRETRDCFLYPVENRTAATLEAVIRQCILPGTDM